MYNDLVKRKEFMENTRKGFYCMMCSVEGQNAIYTRKRLTFFGESAHIKYSKDFCNLLVDHSFPAAYNDYKNLNTYFSNLIKLTTCFTSETNTLNSSNMKIDSDKTPPMSDEMKKLIKNPLNLENVNDLDSCDIARTNGIPFYDCENFCKAFNIAKPVAILDGSPEGLRNIYEYMM